MCNKADWNVQNKILQCCRDEKQNRHLCWLESASDSLDSLTLEKLGSGAGFAGSLSLSLHPPTHPHHTTHGPPPHPPTLLSHTCFCQSSVRLRHKWPHWQTLLQVVRRTWSAKTLSHRLQGGERHRKAVIYSKGTEDGFYCWRRWAFEEGNSHILREKQKHEPTLKKFLKTTSCQNDATSKLQYIEQVFLTLERWLLTNHHDNIFLIRSIHEMTSALREGHFPS